MLAHTNNGEASILFIYSVLVLMLITATAACSHVYAGGAASRREFHELHVRKFEIIMTELYSYYFMAYSIIFRTRRSQYTHVLIYLYYATLVLLGYYGKCTLLIAVIFISSVKCVLMFHFITDDHSIQANDRLEIMDFARFMLHKIRELKESFKTALWFFEIKDGYMLVVGGCPPYFVPTLVLFILSNYFHELRLFYRRLGRALEVAALVLAVSLQIVILVNEQHSDHMLGAVFKCSLLLGDILVTVVLDETTRFGLGLLPARSKKWDKFVPE